ncbi:MAG: hypothetical protein QNK03_16105 [Myxococcota bacterium]|nr:hypothetical protein [Myxococcota bacterium]
MADTEPEQPGAQPPPDQQGGKKDPSEPDPAESSGQEASRALASPGEVLLLVCALLLIFLLLIYLLFAFWPHGGTGDADLRVGVSVFGHWFKTSDEVRIFMLVVLAGAIGSFIHVASSAGDYIGNRNLRRSWLYWYILRLPVGSSIALLIYLLLRGGVMNASGGVDLSEGPPYGIVGLSALAGMFAKKASNKLGEVFDVAFRTSRDEELADKNVRVPVLEEVQPNPLKVSPPGKATTIKLIGDNFQPSYRVLFAGETRKPKYVSDQQLLLELAAEELTTARSITVLVFSPEKEEIRSNAIELVVELET